jgi:hypothetical protein
MRVLDLDRDKDKIGQINIEKRLSVGPREKWIAEHPSDGDAQGKCWLSRRFGYSDSCPPWPYESKTSCKVRMPSSLCTSERLTTGRVSN